MGAGAFPAGVGPAGQDPVLPPPSRLVLAPQGAPVFQLSNKQFVQQSDGTLLTGDEVDQAVLFAIGFPLGVVSSAPTVGNRLGLQGRVDPSRLVQTVTDEVRGRLDSLISSGYIIVTGLTVVTPARGQNFVAVSYWNKRRKTEVPITLRSFF